MLDNEAVQALASVAHRKHRIMLRVLETVATRNGRRAGAAVVVVPTAVRVEAAVDRRVPAAAVLARFRLTDVSLDAQRADRAAALRGAGGSAVDACVAEVAASVPTGQVTVLTADLTDLPRLLAAAGADQVQVYRI